MSLGQDLKAYNTEKDKNPNSKIEENFNKSEGGSSNSSKNRKKKSPVIAY